MYFEQFVEQEKSFNLNIDSSRLDNAEQSYEVLKGNRQISLISSLRIDVFQKWAQNGYFLSI